MRERDDETTIPVNPEARGSENPDAPGEPVRAEQHVSDPVPGTGYERKREHKRAHNAEGNVPKQSDATGMHR